MSAVNRTLMYLRYLELLLLLCWKLVKWDMEKLRHLSEDTLNKWQSWCPTSEKKKEKKSFYCLAVEYVCHLKMRNHIISKIPTHVFCGMKDSWNNVKISGSPDCGNIFSGVKFKHF